MSDRTRTVRQFFSSIQSYTEIFHKYTLIAGEKVFRERPTVEHLLLLFFFTAGIYMYVEAGDFSPATSTFPQLMAAGTAILAMILLFRNYLPQSLLQRIDESSQLFEKRSGDVDGHTSDSASAYSYDIDDPRGPAVVFVLCVAYLVLAYLIGLLYATPIFVGLYTLWADVEHKRAIALVVLSFVIAAWFYLAFSPTVGQGWHTGWTPPFPLGSINSGVVIQWL